MIGNDVTHSDTLPVPTIAGLGLRKRPPFSERRPMDWLPDRLVAMREDALAAARQPFTGITADGHPLRGLFPLSATGISTESITGAAATYLASLRDDQRAVGQLAIDAAEWMTWSNISPFVMRHGLLLEDLSDGQRAAALALLEASLSATGYQAARDVMRLNYSIGELTGAWDEYGEFVYFLTIFGTPSSVDPWGWQLDGHHCNLNCFVLGDQLVLSPAFLGSEPVYAESGKYTATRVFELEERLGLQAMRALNETQRAVATLDSRFLGNAGHIQGGAQRDNIQLPYSGVCYADLSSEQQSRLLDLIRVYTSRMRPGHEQVKLAEVVHHLPDTYFAWYGGIQDTSVFYYRVHSPVLLIEFDHQAGVAFDNDTPARSHIHTVVRTPNGNDYGKDLLRQHYAHHHDKRTE